VCLIVFRLVRKRAVQMPHYVALRFQAPRLNGLMFSRAAKRKLVPRAGNNEP